MSRVAKRRQVEDPRQLSLVFEVPPPVDTTPGALAGLEQRIGGLIGRILKEDTRTREVIAAEMSARLGCDISKAMLDKYAAGSADEHNISAARLLALVAVTHRHDLLDVLLIPIGARALYGQEVIAAQLGSVEARLRDLQAERSRLRALATPIRGGES